MYHFIEVQFTIYFGSFLIIAGVLGNILNILVFSRNNHGNPSIFLLLISSYTSLIYLCASLLIRVLFIGFNIHFLVESTFIWCKIRVHVGQITWFISISCICYAMIDRYFLSIRKEKCRRRSQIQTARRGTILIIFIWILHASPILMHPDKILFINQRFICQSLSETHFNRYIAYFVLPILATTAPISLLLIFGILTYRNLNSFSNLQHRQRVQRPLTSMILLQTCFIIVGSTPLVIFYLIDVIHSPVKQVDSQSDWRPFALSIALVLYAFPHASSFFAYSLSSGTYRRQLKQIFQYSATKTSNIQIRKN